MADPIVVMATMAFLAVAVVLAFIRGTRKQRDAGREHSALASRISRAVGGCYRVSPMSAVSTLKTGVGSATLDGIRFDYSVSVSARYDTRVLTVSVPVASRARFEVGPNSGAGKVLHRIDFRSRVSNTPVGVQTGDAAFDSRYLISCDSADTGRIFSSPDNRAAVQALFGNVAYDGARVMTAMRCAEDFDPAVLSRMVPHLATLAAGIRQERARPSTGPLLYLKGDDWIALGVGMLCLPLLYPMFVALQEHGLSNLAASARNDGLLNVAKHYMHLVWPGLELEIVYVPITAAALKRVEFRNFLKYPFCLVVVPVFVALMFYNLKFTAAFFAGIGLTIAECALWYFTFALVDRALRPGSS